MNEPKPRFLINPALFAPHWTPEPWQTLRYPNPARLNSLWLGTVWNFMVIPTRLWHEVVMPAFVMRNPLVLLAGTALLAWSILCWVWWGASGQLRGIHVDMDTRYDSDILSPEEAVERIVSGDERAVIDTRRPTPQL